MTQSSTQTVPVRGGPRIRIEPISTGGSAARDIVDSFVSSLRGSLISEGYTATDYSPPVNPELAFPRNTGDTVPPVQVLGYSKEPVEPRHEPVIVDDGGILLRYEDGCESMLKVTVREPERNRQIIERIDGLLTRHGLDPSECRTPGEEPPMLPSLQYWIRRE